MNAFTRFLSIVGLSIVLSCVASEARAQYGYYYSNYPAYQSFSVGYSTPYGGYSTFYAPGYSNFYYSAPVYGAGYVAAPSYYTTARVVVPPAPIFRRPVVYAPAVVPVPGFGFRYGF